MTTNVTQVSKNLLSSKRFERFSKWNSLIRTITLLIHIARTFSQPAQENSFHGWHISLKIPTEEELERAKVLVIKSIQDKCYAEQFRCIAAERSLPIDSSLRRLHPIVDSDRLLRVGSRIEQSKLGTNYVNRIIIPGLHHLATLLVHHHKL